MHEVRDVQLSDLSFWEIESLFGEIVKASTNFFSIIRSPNSFSRLNIDDLFSITLNYQMNKGLHLKIFPAAFMLLLLLIVSFFGSEGTLLCFGKDGHMAIEFVDVHNGSGFGAQLAGMENDACGHCKDVQFLSSPAYTRNVSHNTQTIPLISSSSMFPSLPLKEYSKKRINLPEYSHYKTLASLHSVILLI